MLAGLEQGIQGGQGRFESVTGCLGCQGGLFLDASWQGIEKLVLHILQLAAELIHVNHGNVSQRAEVAGPGNLQGAQQGFRGTLGAPLACYADAVRPQVRQVANCRWAGVMRDQAQIGCPGNLLGSTAVWFPAHASLSPDYVSLKEMSNDSYAGKEPHRDQVVV